MMGYGEKYHTADYWTRNIHNTNLTRNIHQIYLAVDYEGNKKYYYEFQNIDVGIRPVLFLPTSKLKNIPHQDDYDETTLFFFGEYPTHVASSDISEILKERYYQKDLETTSKTYTIPGPKDSTIALKEYIFENQKYIRIMHVLADSWQHLSDDSLLGLTQTHWVKVEPIPWLYDEKTGLLISKHSLIAGVPFTKEEVKTFEETSIYHFLNDCLAPELISSSEPFTTSILDKDLELQKFMLKKR